MIQEVLERAYLSRMDIKEMVKEGINAIAIPSSVNVSNQVDHQLTSLRTDVIEELLSEPNVRMRISDSIAEEMKSAQKLALSAKDDQSGDERIPINDAHIGTSMWNPLGNSITRELRIAHMDTKARTYLLRDEGIVRGVAKWPRKR